MNKMIYAMSSLLVMTLVSCSRDALGPPHDVPYFKAHVDERRSLLAKCDADPGRYGANANCVNAREADLQRLIGNDSGVPRLPNELGLTAEERARLQQKPSTKE